MGLDTEVKPRFLNLCQPVILVTRRRPKHACFDIVSLNRSYLQIHAIAHIQHTCTIMVKAITYVRINTSFLH